MGEGAVRNLMQAAIRRSVLSAFLRVALAAVTIAAGGSVQPAGAQAPNAEGPPMGVGGWRYEKGANDVHLFHCEMAACVPGSRVSYRFYPVGTTIPFAQYRSEQEMVAKALQQRATPGTKITVVAIEGEDVETLPRMYKTRRLTVLPDGSQEHVHSGILMGEHGAVSLISSSRDEKAVGANYTQYGIGLLLLIQKARDTKK
jgi:hypothetical protein